MEQVPKDNIFEWQMGIRNEISKPIKKMEGDMSRFHKTMRTDGKKFSDQVLKMGAVFSLFLGFFSGSKMKKATEGVHGQAKAVKGLKQDTEDLQKEFAAFSSVYDELIEHGVDSEKAMRHTSKSFQEHTKRAEEHHGLLHKLIHKTTHFLHKQAEAFEEIGFSWKNAVGALGATSLAGVFIKLVEYANEHVVAINALNQQMLLTPGITHAAEGAIGSLVGVLGKTVEDLLPIAGLGLSFGIMAKESHKAAQELKTFTEQTFFLAEGTGMATDSAGEMLDTVTRLYGTGYENARRFGSAFKYISDNTRLSANELASYVNSLSELAFLYPELNKDQRETMVEGLMNVAGALSDVGVKGEELTSMWVKLKDEADTGAGQLLGVFGDATGMGFEDLLSTIHAGDFDTLFKRMIQGFKTKAPTGDRARILSQQFADVGVQMSKQNILTIRDMSVEQFETLQANAKKNAELMDLQAKAAKRREDQMFGPWRRLKAEFTKGAAGVGHPLLHMWNTVSNKIVDGLIALGKKITPHLERVTHWIEHSTHEIAHGIEIVSHEALRIGKDLWAGVQKVFFDAYLYWQTHDVWAEIKAAASDAWAFFKKILPDLKMAFSAIVEVIKTVYEWFSKLTPQQKEMAVQIGLVVEAVGLFNKASGGMVTSLAALALHLGPTGVIIGGLAALAMVLWETGKAMEENETSLTGIANAYGLVGKEAREFGSGGFMGMGLDLEDMRESRVALNKLRKSTSFTDQAAKSRAVLAGENGYVSDIGKMAAKLHDPSQQLRFVVDQLKASGIGTDNARAVALVEKYSALANKGMASASTPETVSLPATPVAEPIANPMVPVGSKPATASDEKAATAHLSVAKKAVEEAERQADQQKDTNTILLEIRDLFKKNVNPIPVISAPRRSSNYPSTAARFLEGN